jgi:uncharacterized protein with HEPN domain
MRSDAEQNALRDILHQIDLAQNFTHGQDRQTFSADIMRVYAVTRGDHFRSLAPSVRRPQGTASRLPWEEMAGAGNIYGHDYEDVAAPRVWDTVQSALPPIARRDRAGTRASS